MVKGGNRFITLIVALVLITVTLTLTGCVNLLEDFVETVTEHEVTPNVRPPTELVSVSDYDELIAEILRLIALYEAESQLLYFSHDGADVQQEIERARFEILNDLPLGAYAVAEISINTTRIVTHYEIDISIEFSRTKEQIESIIAATTERFLRTQLLSRMSQYRDDIIFRTTMDLTEESVIALINDTYYQNPRRIVMLPIVTVEIFPEDGPDRIFAIGFGNTENAAMLQQFGEILVQYVQRNADEATGNTEAEVLLSLVERLMGSTAFDEALASTITHGSQNFAATAFGALFREIAVGEGFAMALKALADELGFDCQVVLGYYEGRVHAWNIISLYGDYYHVDAAMCVVNGLETAFLKTDEDFAEKYEWDRTNTVKCEGELTLSDILNLTGPEEPGDDNTQNVENNGEED